MQELERMLSRCRRGLRVEGLRCIVLKCGPRSLPMNNGYCQQHNACHQGDDVEEPSIDHGDGANLLGIARIVPGRKRRADWHIRLVACLTPDCTLDSMLQSVGGLEHEHGTKGTPSVSSCGGATGPRPCHIPVNEQAVRLCRMELKSNAPKQLQTPARNMIGPKAPNTSLSARVFFD